MMLRAKEGLNVYNSANTGSVDGPFKGTNGTRGPELVAVPDPQEPFDETNTSDPSKLVVGPAVLLPAFESSPNLFGSYWVVAAGSSDGSCSYLEDLEECRAVAAYEWAIITGGPPSVATETGCRTGTPGASEEQFFGGLWLFSREPQSPENKEIMMAKAEELGLDTSVLLEVEHEGCSYPES
ncbi:hypothetical protein DUNSADRAFT_17169 [Dunaliella salina]|uniref:Uncharacterized protein n=1 Tax=Dunaliella salina TaxID=3046 RepID=A0ABQ7H0D9_DUNSA|nr:hypothetical protein DUNSADRAFT_17169 [Dunaliella salina]|eukprot:KAF5840325.1 hypothetical protein DUNSADRAFT_17169 [Dunaliella salina]